MWPDCFFFRFCYVACEHVIELVASFLIDYSYFCRFPFAGIPPVRTFLDKPVASLRAGNPNATRPQLWRFSLGAGRRCGVGKVARQEAWKKPSADSWPDGWRQGSGRSGRNVLRTLLGDVLLRDNSLPAPPMQ